MKKLAREILFLKRGERHALFTVCILLFLSLGFRIVIPNIKHAVDEPDQAFFDQLERLRYELDSMEKYLPGSSDQQKYVYNSKEQKKASQPLLPHSFDPNSASQEELSAMHMPEKVIANLISYREAGGEFHSSNDIRRIYGLEDSVFYMIKDYVSIETASIKDKTQSIQQDFAGNDADKQESYEALKIELNEADSADLVRIRGIGPFSAQTIIRYRSLLGGYYALSQLMEVYGMDSSRYDLLCESLFIDSSVIKQLNINEVSYGELLRHPYISKQQVTELIHYRDYAKEIVSPLELKKFGILDSASYARIAPYISCRIN